MVTHTEMELVDKLVNMCSNEYDKNALIVLRNLLSNLETNKVYNMSDDERKIFLKPFANKINGFRSSAVISAQAQGLTNAIKEHYANRNMKAAYDCWCGLYSLFVPAEDMDEKARFALFAEQQKYMEQIDNETVYAVTDYGKQKVYATFEESEHKIHEDSDGIVCEGHFGTWYVIETEIIEDRKLFLLEHEEYGDEAACIIVDEDGQVVCEDVYNGFDDYVDMRLNELQAELTNVINEREGLPELSDRGILLDNAYYELENRIMILSSYDADENSNKSLNKKIDEAQERCDNQAIPEYKGYFLRRAADGLVYPFKPRPYDDASYHYAHSTDAAHWTIGYKGKRHSVFEGSFRDIVDKLEELNKDIRPQMCHM